MTIEKTPLRRRELLGALGVGAGVAAFAAHSPAAPAQAASEKI